jgi:hypothetical protein
MKVLTLALATALTLSLGSPAAHAAGETQQRGYAAKTERGQLAGQIVRTWAGYVHQVYGTAPATWAQAMAGTFEQADIGNMRRASQMHTYEAMTATLLGQKTSDASVINKLAQSDGSLRAVKSLGSPAGDLVYTMVAPCRIVDTRLAGGIMTGGATRNFFNNAGSFAGQGGAASDCGIPAEPSAVVLNVTVVNPAGAGYVKVFPYGIAAPNAASVNYAAHQTVGNELIVKQTIGQPFDFSIFTLATAHVVVDITGYFMAPVATALDCTTVDSSGVTINAGANGQAFPPSCASGYTQTAMYCRTASWDTDVSNISPTYGCTFKNNTGSAVTAVASSRCCRVPGR